MAIVTFSRLYGSGGSEVAAKVAHELGWSLLDNAVVDQVAARLGITRAEVAAREERVPSLVERITDALTLGSQEWITPMTAARRPPTDEQLIEMTRHVVDEAVASGPLVIVGRGAQAMLAARSDALHIFCHAPRATLISRVMERDRLGHDEAAKLVDETNAHREMWVRRHWDRAWKNPENYHLSVNTGWLGIEGASEVIVFAARARFRL
ncbi:MAG: AAA family ATPase [Gemmatimonadaceae bacterium]